MGEVRKEIINNLYETHSLPTGLSGLEKLYKAAKVIDGSITRQDVRSFLEGKDSHTLHKITHKRFQRRKMVAPKPKVNISCDLADMRQLSKYNNGYNYLLICIDIFSRFLDVVPLKRKNASSLLTAMKSLLEKDEFEGVSRILTDKGSEFYNRPLLDYLSSKNKRLYSVSSFEIKASLAERVIRTLKSKIYKYLTSRNTLKYIDVLNDLINSYNTAKHRGLGGELTPREVHAIKDEKLIKLLFSVMYKTKSPRSEGSSTTLAIGTTVRISDSARLSKFRKGYKQQNTVEIFKIYKIDNRQYPTGYYLEDLAGERVSGIFYKQELIRTTLPETFPIDIIRKKKVNGRYKYLVSWRGYPESFNSWIDESDMTKLT